MKRTKPLPARTKPIARGAPPKRRTPVRQGTGRRFAKRRNAAYAAWIRTLPCILAGRPKHVCEGPVECCHVRTRAAGAYDVGETFPACRKVHVHQHLIGIKSFERYYSLSLSDIAVRLGQEWEAAA